MIFQTAMGLSPNLQRSWIWLQRWTR